MAMRLNQRIEVILAVGIVEDSVCHSNYDHLPTSAPRCQTRVHSALTSTTAWKINFKHSCFARFFPETEAKADAAIWGFGHINPGMVSLVSTAITNRQNLLISTSCMLCTTQLPQADIKSSSKLRAELESC